MSKVGVVGGSGFVGSFLLRSLDDANVPFVCFDTEAPAEPHRYVKLDIETPGTDAFVGIDTIINLAAVHRDDVRPLSRYTDINVDGAKKICAVASDSGVSRIIFTSSVAIFGFAPPDTNESGAPNYFNEYGKTKFEAEQVYKEWQAEHPEQRTLVIVRPTVIFGPGNRGNVYNLLKQIASQRFMMFGDGRNIKSMAYVENVVQFLVQCTNLNPGVHVYNYIDKPDLSMNELVHVARKTLFDKSGVGLRMPGFFGVIIGVGFDLLAWLIRRPLPVSSIRVKKFMATTQFSSAVSETGFEAPYTLAEGLEKTLRYEFLEDNRDKPTYETE